MRSLHDILNFAFETEADKAAARELEEQWLHAWRNAVGLLRVNVSLAIRNAFDAIHDHRIAAGTSIDWTATGVPEPSRYAGSDINGYPLDPDHPWNKELPPEQRAKRLAEIEEYVTAREAAERGDADTS